MKAIRSLFVDKEQVAAVKEQTRKADAVAAGQEKARSGGLGLLAFVDETLAGTFGGGTRTRSKGGLLNAAKTLGGAS